MEKAKQLEKSLKIKFKKIKNLETALTHRSWVNENKRLKPENNERLEFLGDAILELWVTKNLFYRFPQLPEGSLTNIRASLVRTENLAKKSRLLGIDQALLLGRGEEQGGGRKNPSLLADAFEAVVGAIFVDQGSEAAEKFLKKSLWQDLLRQGKKGDVKDAKTLFQELVQEKEKVTPDYQVVSESGPEHEKIFKVKVMIGKKQMATGKGKSKKEAEEAAAAKGLTLYRKKRKIQPKKND